MEPLFLDERVSYYPSVERPLSSDVFIIRGDTRVFVFDVGNSDEITSSLNEIHVPKTVIISHFHSDHTAHLEDTVFDELLVGNQTYKSVRQGRVVDAPITINDGVEFYIFPIPSVHAKGSLGLMIDGNLAFLGDATYSMWKDGHVIYNAQLLKEEIKVLGGIPADRVVLSHDGGHIRPKKAVIRLLEHIYSLRKSDSPYIYYDEEENC